jgi:hypothetical protein
VIVAILAAVYACVLLFDFRPSHRAGAPGEKALYLSLLAISFVVIVLHDQGVEIPSPTTPIENAVRLIFGIS